MKQGFVGLLVGASMMFAYSEFGSNKPTGNSVDVLVRPFAVSKSDGQISFVDFLAAGAPTFLTKKDCEAFIKDPFNQSFKNINLSSIAGSDLLKSSVMKPSGQPIYWVCLRVPTGLQD
tara:strand:- start:1376 stop:1729 length:354 start_codon:yes stop_codon:yes gene_type:complete